MAGIGDIVSITITANTRTPSAVGFGTPLLLSYHTRFPERFRRYSDLDEMIADGFQIYDAAYLMAQALLSQDPHPEVFMVGRLSAAPTHTQTLTATSSTEGQHVKVKVTSPLGVETAFDYTILASATTSTVATAVAALINALTGVAASAVGAVITVTPEAAGGFVGVASLQNLTLKGTTADADYDDELSLIVAEDDDFYFIAIDINSEANIDKVAAWAESRTKIFVAATANYDELAGTGTILTDLKTLGYDRTGILWAPHPRDFAAAALIGRVAAKDPGSINWAFKDLDGVTPAVITTTQETTLKNNNAILYQTIAGLNVTRYGKAVGGEYLDVTHGIDWLKARIQESVFGLIAGVDKLPYTDASVDAVKGNILGVLNLGVQRDFLRPGTLSVTAPEVADVSTTDRANRYLPDVKFGAELAGAINSVGIAGTLSV